MGAYRRRDARRVLENENTNDTNPTGVLTRAVMGGQMHRGQVVDDGHEQAPTIRATVGYLSRISTTYGGG